MVKSLIKTCYTYITELERGAMVRIIICTFFALKGRLLTQNFFKLEPTKLQTKADKADVKSY